MRIAAIVGVYVVWALMLIVALGYILVSLIPSFPKLRFEG